MWTPSERRFFRSLSSPERIQAYLDSLRYNPSDDALSPRYVILSGDGHCLEGGLLAAAALEFHGQKPLMVDLLAHNDDRHVITVYKAKTGWGSVSKSNTTLLRGRTPYYKSVRELVMSYFDFYFNTKGKLSLHAYSDPIDLNRYNHWNWRTSDENLLELGMSFLDVPHHEIVPVRRLGRHGPVRKGLQDACFSGADKSGLYRA